MESQECNKDELYEIEVEEALKRQENEGSGGDDENEIFHDATDFVTVMSSGSDVTQSRMEAGVSEEVMNHQEKSWTAFLDSVFGELPPKSLIRFQLLFTKPPNPPQRPPSKHSLALFPTKTGIAHDKGSQEANTDILKKEGTHEDGKKRYVRIGGMLVMPVPVEGPCFADVAK